MSQNAICVYRDVKKAERLSEMYDENMPPEQIADFRTNTRDGKFIVRKQRATGDLPVCGYMFENRFKRFFKDQSDLEPYYRIEEEIEGLSAPNEAPPNMQMSEETIDEPF